MTSSPKNGVNIIESSNLTSHYIEFCLYLKEKGFLIGPQETSEGLLAIQMIDLTDREQVQTVLRLVLCSRLEEIPIFDHAFQAFFIRRWAPDPSKKLLHYLSEKKEGRPSSGEREPALKHSEKKPSLLPSGSYATKEQQVKTGSEPTRLVPVWLASLKAYQADQSFRIHITMDEYEKVVSAANMLVKKMNKKVARRWKASKKGKKIHFRKTMRGSFQTGGEPIVLSRLIRKRTDARFIFLCDASRSMSETSSKFLSFAHALVHCSKNAEVFLFSTKLKRVTRQLKQNRSQNPVLQVRGKEWGGGTRIGESLSDFVREYGHRMLTKHSVVLIASDGLEAGNVEQLAWAMKEIKRRASFIAWLNPLLKLEGYEPSAIGMKTALPFIDLFAQADDAASFQQLAKKF